MIKVNGLPDDTLTFIHQIPQHGESMTLEINEVKLVIFLDKAKANYQEFSLG